MDVTGFLRKQLRQVLESLTSPLSHLAASREVSQTPVFQGSFRFCRTDRLLAVGVSDLAIMLESHLGTMPQPDDHHREQMLSGTA